MKLEINLKWDCTPLPVRAEGVQTYMFKRDLFDYEYLVIKRGEWYNNVEVSFINQAGEEEGSYDGVLTDHGCQLEVYFG